MIERYSTPEMTAVWADTTRFGRWLEVELLATEAHADARGGARPPTPRRAATGPRSSTRRSWRPSLERERTTDHDVAAFVDVVQQRIGGPEAAWIHYGLTSSDVVDTALCWALRDAADLVLESTDDARHDAGRHRPHPPATRS